MQPRTLLIVACLLIVAPVVVASAAVAEPVGDGVPCVDIKPDDPTDPVDVYECPDASEP